MLHRLGKKMSKEFYGLEAGLILKSVVLVVKMIKRQARIIHQFRKLTNLKSNCFAAYH